MSHETNNFETLFAELQQVVQRLESGEIELDEMLKSFERGVQLIRECRGMLDGAQARIQHLIEIDENGNARLRDFEHTASMPAEAAFQNNGRPARKSASYKKEPIAPADELELDEEDLLF